MFLVELGPVRRLLPVVLLQAFGLGAMATLGVVYGSRVLGLTNAQIGAALTIAYSIGLGMGVPFGHLADRIGPRGLLAGLLVAEGIAAIGYLATSSWATFVLALTAYQMFDRAASAVRGGLIAKALPKSEQAIARSYFRAVGNAAAAVGAIAFGIALQIDTLRGYQALAVGCGIAYWIAVWPLLTIPTTPPASRHNRVRFGAAFRDGRYMAFAFLNALLTFHFAVLELAMPLWIVQQTSVPRYLVTVMFLINTVAVVTLQLPVGRRIANVLDAKRATVAAGVLLFASCLLFGLSALASTALAVILLVVAGALHALGEIAQAAGAFTLAYELAPANAHGQYQGLYSTSTSAGMVFGSSVIGVLVLDHGLTGWLAIGVLFLIAGCASHLVVTEARRRDETHL